MKIITFILASISLANTSISSEQKEYNTPVPPSIMTPNKMETRIGTLEFFDGYPTDKTVKKVYNHLNFIRGVEVFLNSIPAASLEAMRKGLKTLGDHPL